MGWRDWTGVGERRWKTAPNEQVQPSKTVWDWLQLLIVPAILVGVTFAWSYTQTQSANRREDRRIAADRAAADQARQDTALNGYVKQMSDLMLDRKLLTSKWGDAVRSVARTVTLSTLRRLNGERKVEVVRFLTEAQLIDTPNARVDLFDADLRGAELRGAELMGADLNHADLTGADLGFADLTYANLRGSDLTGADLSLSDLMGANLRAANLTDANLRGASGLTQEQVHEALTDQGSKLPKYLGVEQSD